MNADGSNPTQLTHNALWDEGPAWSPDGTLIAYSSGSDNDHLDINVMTAAGVHLRTLTDYPGHDESPDWQPIPAPPTDRRCGDLTEAGPGVRDVRAAAMGSLRQGARARRTLVTVRNSGNARQSRGFHADVNDFGGTHRVVLTHRGRSPRRRHRQRQARGISQSAREHGDCVDVLSGIRVRPIADWLLRHDDASR